MYLLCLHTLTESVIFTTMPYNRHLAHQLTAYVQSQGDIRRSRTYVIAPDVMREHSFNPVCAREVSEHMNVDRNLQHARFAQCGFVMRAYRESYVEPGRSRGMSQDGLLRRMAEVDDDRGRRFSHSTVTRWESGATRPTVERLKIFGKALGLSGVEVAGLMMLAGRAPDFETAGRRVGILAPEPKSVPSTDTQPGGPTPEAGGKGDGQHGLLWNPRLRFAGLQLLLPVLYVVAGGYALGAMGWDDAWMPLAYVLATSLLIMAQAFVWPDRRAGLRDFYWASMFIVLVTPALRFACLGLDQYGFYRLGDSAGTHHPHMMMMLAGVVLAGASALVFDFLWSWQNSPGRAGRCALVRSAWSLIPPTLACYAVVVTLSGTIVWIQSTVAMPILAAVVIAMQVVRDPETRPDPAQCRFLLQAAFTIVIVAATLGAIVIVAVYGSPYAPMTLPDHNLLGSWEIDFDRLGYTGNQVMERLEIGYTWHRMCLYAYMVAVLGGGLLVGVYRLADRAVRHPAPRQGSDQSGWARKPTVRRRLRSKMLRR